MEIDYLIRFFCLFIKNVQNLILMFHHSLTLFFLYLLQFDEKVLEALKVEIRATFDAANTSEMREIKGLEERLYGLEQLRCDAKKIVQEQTDLAQVRFFS